MVHRTAGPPGARASLTTTVRVVESSATEQRLAEARAFVAARSTRGEEVLLVGASRGAVDDLARSIASEAGATLGLHRFSVTQLAARLAAPSLAGQGLAPSTALGSEAVAARAVFEAARGNGLAYFGPVAKSPGFPRALTRTIQEVRLAGLGAPAIGRLPLGGCDLSTLLEAFDEQFTAASATDRATLFATAAAALGELKLRPAGTPGGAATASTPALVLLDVPFESAVEGAFLNALIASAPGVLITVPFGDVQTLDALASLGF